MKSEQNSNQEFFQIIYGRHNNYRVKGVLGHGAISEVLLGSICNEEDPFNEQDVAIKVLKNTTFIGNQENKYFFQEKDIVHKLSTQRDDHIVNIIEVIETNDQYYIIMEYCENGSLLDQIYLEIPNRLKVVVNFSTQLTKGIHFLHAHGIAHRDLKPENIFIHEKDQQYILKIGDYGLGKNEEIYMMHSCIGTINYMAPEMIRKQEYDFTVDVWALGCIMHELITGEQLFADFTIAEISNQIRSMEEYRCIEGNFGYLISRCLQPVAANRIKVNDLYKELYRLYDDIVTQRIEIVHRVIFKNYREQQSSQQLTQQPVQQINGNQSNTQMVVSQIFANSQEYFNTNEIQDFGADNSIDPSLSICINKDFQHPGAPLTPSNINNSNFQNTPSQYNNNYLNPNQNTFFKDTFLNKQNAESNENISQNNIQKTDEGNNTNTGTQPYSIENDIQNQQAPNQLLKSQGSLDPRYLDLNRTQGYIFYQDKDTQQALRKKAQYNKKKGKTHKIKKQKEIFNNLNLKHADSVTFLAQESPSTSKSNKFNLENRFDLSQIPSQLQVFPYVNGMASQIPSPSQLQQNQQPFQPFINYPPPSPVPLVDQDKFQQQNQNYNNQQIQIKQQQKQYLVPPGQQQYLPKQQFQEDTFQINQYQAPQQQQYHQLQFQQPTPPNQHFQIPQTQFQSPQNNMQNQFQGLQQQFQQKQQIQQQPQVQQQLGLKQQPQQQQPQNNNQFLQNQNQQLQQFQQPQQVHQQYQQIQNQNPQGQNQQLQQFQLQTPNQNQQQYNLQTQNQMNLTFQNHQAQNETNQSSLLNTQNQQFQQQLQIPQLQYHQQQPQKQQLQHPQQQQFEQPNKQQFPPTTQQKQYQSLPQQQQLQQQQNPFQQRQNLLKTQATQNVQQEGYTPPILSINTQFENQQYNNNSNFSFNQSSNGNNTISNNNTQHYNSSSNYNFKFNLNMNGNYQSSSSPNHQLNNIQNEGSQLISNRGIYLQQQPQQQQQSQQPQQSLNKHEDIMYYQEQNRIQNGDQFQNSRINDKNNIDTQDYQNKFEFPHQQFQRLSIQNSTNRDSINSNLFSNSANENQDYYSPLENDFYKNDSYQMQQDQFRKNQETQSYYYQIPTNNFQQTYTPQQEEQVYNRP